MCRLVKVEIGLEGQVGMKGDKMFRNILFSRVLLKLTGIQFPFSSKWKATVVL